jgi:hypothetical protein
MCDVTAYAEYEFNEVEIILYFFHTMHKLSFVS